MKKEIIKVSMRDLTNEFGFSPLNKQGLDISEFISWLNESKEKGASHLDFGCYMSDEFEGNITITPSYFRHETDDEFNKRQDENKKWSSKFEESQRAEYEKLKAKFEGK